MQPEFAPQIAPRASPVKIVYSTASMCNDGGGRGRRAAGGEVLGPLQDRPGDAPPATGGPVRESRVGDTLSYVTRPRDATRHDDGVDTTG